MSTIIASTKQHAKTAMGIQGFPIIMLINIFLGISFAFVLPFNSLFGIDEVGMSNTTFGIFMLVSSICGIVFSTWIAKLSDRVPDRKFILILCSIAGVVGYIGFAFSRDYYVLLAISSIFLGISSSTFAQVFAIGREILTRSDLPAKQLPLYMNILRTVFALSWTVGPAIAAYVLLYLGFVGLFAVAATCNAVVAVIALLFLNRGRVATAPKTAASNVPLMKIVFQPVIFVNLIAFTFISTANTLSTMNMAQYVTKVLGGNKEHIGIIFSIPPVFEVFFMLGFGYLATRMKSDRLIRLGALIAFIYFTTLFFAGSPWHIYIVQILSAAYISITSGIAITYFQDFLPEMPGTATNLYSNSNKVGSMLGFLLFGVIADAFGYRSVYLACASFALVAVVLLFGLAKAKNKGVSTGAMISG
ncbi:sugar efflux transporter [Paenibacillus sp. GSMTC-2017]|uniref:sugar efflux transporter n=1 Tax=Paenibacillus sp. GSMTC-2017 TaxID=2794350 RepID=UPI0018DA3507|nr:sugar efflux transporter [Paenibacillus sp. GSMTC-2017]MBH5319845.1 sugar efflux transporter [Paenibacillus sp. GSMTC-2017]